MKVRGKEEEAGLLRDCPEGHEGGAVVRAKLELGEMKER